MISYTIRSDETGRELAAKVARDIEGLRAAHAETQAELDPLLARPTATQAAFPRGQRVVTPVTSRRGPGDSSRNGGPIELRRGSSGPGRTCAITSQSPAFRRSCASSERATFIMSLRGSREVAKRASCLVGRHSWTTRAVQGESVKVCSACGKTGRDNKGDPELRRFMNTPVSTGEDDVSVR